MSYVKNPDTQPGKKGQSNITAIENQVLGSNVDVVYGTGQSFVPGRNVATGMKATGIIGSEKAVQLDVSHRAGVSSLLDIKAEYPSSQSWLLNKGLAEFDPNKAIQLDYNNNNFDKPYSYLKGTNVVFTFTTGGTSGGIGIDVNPYYSENYYIDERMQDKMVLYTGTPDNLTVVPWTSNFGSGLYVDGQQATTYYLRIYNMPTGILTILVEDD